MHRDRRWIEFLHENGSVLRVTGTCFVAWEEAVGELALSSPVRGEALEILAGLIGIRELPNPSGDCWIPFDIGERPVFPKRLPKRMFSGRAVLVGRIAPLDRSAAFCERLWRTAFLVVSDSIDVLVQLLRGSEALSGRHPCGKAPSALGSLIGWCVGGKARRDAGTFVLDKAFG